MKFARYLALLAALVFACASSALAASPEKVLVPKISSFDFFVDYSGSMAMKHAKLGKDKIVVAKELMTAINAKIPALGYKGGLHTFAPSSEVIAQGPWDRVGYEKGIKSLKSNFDIFGRLTPMSQGFEKALPYVQNMQRKAAVILISDGEANVGMDPVTAAKAVAALKDVCIHVISLADTAKGQATLDAISKLSPCSVSVNGADLLNNEKALDKFVRDVFYDEQAPKAAAAPMEEVIVLRNVQFALNSAKLDASATSILTEAARIIKANPGKKLLVAGHTCNLGTDAYNLKLSDARAKSVKDFLVKQGVEASRLDTFGFGESQPKYDNGTEQGRSMNRRVELSFR